MAGGFAQLGDILGGGIDREGARLEGLAAGSTINNRNANTTNALAQARLRRDEQLARDALGPAFDALGLPSDLAVAGRAGLGNLTQLVGGLQGQQDIDLRNTIANSTLPVPQRQSAAQAVSGKPLTAGDMLGAGGELGFDVFNMDPNAAVVTPTGRAQIGLDESAATENLSTAALNDEKRLHPERFKNSTSFNFGGKSLSELVLPGLEGTSVVPSGIDPSAALGVEGMFKNSINGLVDFFGGGAPFVDNAVAQNTLSELSARTQLSMLADVPGGRPNVRVLELMRRYAEDPSQLFRGDDLARNNLQTTLASLQRSKKRIAQMLDSPTKKTPTRQGELEQQLNNVADTVADYEAVVNALNAKHGPLAGTEDATEVTTQGLPPGWSVETVQ